jgi:ABC-type amino acid transport system permease subunit
MPEENLPTQTPNVVVENPQVRKLIGNVLAVASLLLAIAVLVDGAIEQLDYAYITAPAATIIGGLFGIFQLGVTRPNIPTE